MAHNDNNGGGMDSGSNNQILNVAVVGANEGGGCSSSNSSSSSSAQSLLGRLRNFLPRIASANAALTVAPAADVATTTGDSNDGTTGAGGCSTDDAGEEAVTVHIIDSDDDVDSSGDEDVDVVAITETTCKADEGKENGVCCDTSIGHTKSMAQPKQFIQFDVLLCKTTTDDDNDSAAGHDKVIDIDDDDDDDNNGNAVKVQTTMTTMAHDGEPLSKKKYLIVDHS